MKKNPKTIQDLVELILASHELYLDALAAITRQIGDPDLDAYMVKRLIQYRDEILDKFGSRLPPEATGPVPFAGAEADRLANRESHQWVDSDGEIRCFRCDAKTWHAAADYPCGEKVPRQVIR